MREAGWDPETGPRLPALLERHGLHRVEGECWRSYQRGGSPMPSIFASTLSRLRPLMLDTGLDECTLDAALERPREPALGLHGPTVWTARGWRWSGLAVRTATTAAPIAGKAAASRLVS